MVHKNSICVKVFYLCCFCAIILEMEKLKISESAIIDLMGGTNKVARLCRVASSNVSTWRKDGIPRQHLMFLAARIEKESHGLVTRKDLFPNNFWLIWPEMLEKSNAFGLQTDSEEE
jgi:DNA-binding transcriptional regulator YdaS (Cro superfamily)